MEQLMEPYFHRLLGLLMDEPMVVLMVEHLEQCLAPQKALWMHAMTANL